MHYTPYTIPVAGKLTTQRAKILHIIIIFIPIKLIELPKLLNFSGKTSDTIMKGIGPHEIANTAMYRHPHTSTIHPVHISKNKIRVHKRMKVHSQTHIQ